ncbi:MAG: nucleoside hydrolase [Clostridia bacterium]|nr:nucleoside hydrolase [Clostridia bacterium]
MTIREILEDIKSERKKKVILDTDAYNEIDDQFAIAYFYYSERADLLAVCAEHYMHDRCNSRSIGMKKSYNEIVKVLSLCDPHYSTETYLGSTDTVENSGAPVESEAADAIIRIARESEEIVYVVAIGALTNVASAIMKAPDIKEKICVLFVGCRPLAIGCPVEYNVEQDYRAAVELFESGVPLIIVPDAGVTSTLRSPIDCTAEIKGANPVCDYLYDISYNAYRAVGCPPTWARTIWDLGAPAIFETPECATCEIMPRPILTPEQTYDYDDSRPEMIMVTALDRDPIFKRAWEVLKRGKAK